MSDIRYYLYIRKRDEAASAGLPQYGFKRLREPRIFDYDLNFLHDGLFPTYCTDREMLAKRLFGQDELEGAKANAKLLLYKAFPHPEYEVEAIPVNVPDLETLDGLLGQGDHRARLLPIYTEGRDPAQDTFVEFAWLSERPDAAKRTNGEIFYRRRPTAGPTEGEALVVVAEHFKGFKNVEFLCCAAPSPERALRFAFYEPAYATYDDDVQTLNHVAESLLRRAEADALEPTLRISPGVLSVNRLSDDAVWTYVGWYPFSRLPFDSMRDAMVMPAGPGWPELHAYYNLYLHQEEAEPAAEKGDEAASPA